MQSAIGKMGRVAAFRLGPGEDVIQGLAEACKKHNIDNGMILVGFGSVWDARFCNPVPIPGSKAGYGYSEPTVISGPLELTATSGLICTGEDGELLFHIHCNYSDKNGNAWGGHMVDGNKTLITVEFVIAEMEDVLMGRRCDESVDSVVFYPVQK